MKKISHLFKYHANIFLIAIIKPSALLLIREVRIAAMVLIFYFGIETTKRMVGAVLNLSAEWQWVEWTLAALVLARITYWLAVFSEDFFVRVAAIRMSGVLPERSWLRANWKSLVVACAWFAISLMVSIYITATGMTARQVADGSMVTLVDSSAIRALETQKAAMVRRYDSLIQLEMENKQHWDAVVREQKWLFPAQVASQQSSIKNLSVHQQNKADEVKALNRRIEEATAYMVSENKIRKAQNAQLETDARRNGRIHGGLVECIVVFCGWCIAVYYRKEKEKEVAPIMSTPGMPPSAAVGEEAQDENRRNVQNMLSLRKTGAITARPAPPVDDLLSFVYSDQFRLIYADQFLIHTNLEHDDGVFERHVVESRLKANVSKLHNGKENPETKQKWIDYYSFLLECFMKPGVVKSSISASEGVSVL